MHHETPPKRFIAIGMPPMYFVNCSVHKQKEKAAEKQYAYLLRAYVNKYQSESAAIDT